MTTNQKQEGAKMKVELSVYVGIGRNNNGDFHCFGAQYALGDKVGLISGGNGYELVKIGNYTLEIDEDINIDAMTDKYRADVVNKEKQRLLDSLAALEAQSAKEQEA